MSCIIEYDLMDKVNESNDIASIKPILGEVGISVASYGILSGLVFLAETITGGKANDAQWLINLSLISTVFLTRITKLKVNNRRSKDARKLEVTRELTELLKELEDKLNIHTNVDLLRKSRINKDERGLPGKNIPILKQNKYIYVPAFVLEDDTNLSPSLNGCEEIKEVSILQEHRLLTDKYVLSLVEKKKK